jgi:hypothetical protein
MSIAQSSSTQRDASSMAELGSVLEALSTDLRVAATSLPNPFEIIPERVKLNRRLKIVSSRIPGAGRGVMVLEKVFAGEQILEIEDPMFTVVCSHSTPACIDHKLLI